MLSWRAAGRATFWLRDVQSVAEAAGRGEGSALAGRRFSGNALPRYYFDVIDGDRQTRDEEGLVLANRESARREAIASLLDLARDELPDGDHRSFLITVRDACDRYLLTVTLAVDADWADADWLETNDNDLGSGGPRA